MSIPGLVIHKCRWCDRECANGTGLSAHERHCPKRPGARREAARTNSTTCSVCDEPYELGTLAEHRKTCKGSATAQIAATVKAPLPGIKDLAFDPGPDEPLDLVVTDPVPLATRLQSGIRVTITVSCAPSQVEAVMRALAKVRA